MPSLRLAVVGAVAILYQAASVSGYAYGLAVMTNQAISDNGGG